jgi:acyl-CoA synthetase (AMP-forming)/AMP-acid ligase II
MHKLEIVKREVTLAISTRMASAFADLVLVPPGSIPFTSSGMVRRAACVEQYRHGPVRPFALSPVWTLRRLGASLPEAFRCR